MYNYGSELPSIPQNNIAWADTFFFLKNLAVTMFEWKGLPDTVNSRYLEETLFNYGQAVFFNDKSLGWLALQAAPQGVNVYSDPTSIRPVSAGNFNFPDLPMDSCVHIRNNFDCFPTFMTCYRYTDIVYDIESARNTNINAQKTPVLIITDQKQRVTMENVYKKYIGNVPVIFGNKDNFDPNSVKVLKTDAPFVCANLQDLKVTILNEYLTRLGIGKAGEKRERYISDEVNQYDREANASANVMLAARELAAKEMSELSGYNITVGMRTQVQILETAYPGNASAVNYTSERVGEGRN